MNPQSPSMQGKVVLVTGGTSGIGKSLAIELARQGAHVIVTGRDAARGQEALAEIQRQSGSQRVELMLADFLSQRSLREFARAFREKHPRLDVLVNNAGGMFQKRTVTEDGVEATLALNLVAPALLTQELLEPLKAAAPSRVINLATKIPPGTFVNFQDPRGEKGGYSPFQAYGRAKLALIMLTQQLAAQLEGSGITVNSLHPGIILGTRFAHDAPKAINAIAQTVAKLFRLNSPMEEGIATPLYLATSPEVGATSGQYFIQGKPASLPKQARDTSARQRVWELSQRLLRPAQA